MISLPEPLGPQHDLAAFDCGRPTLNHWLRKKALKAQQVGGSARTYVVCAEARRVVGYFSLATGSVCREETPGAVRRNMLDPLPVVLMARLTVDNDCRGQGIGSGLLKDALLRIAGAAKEIGIRAALVHCLDEEARRFYLKYGFRESPTNEMTLMLRVSDILSAIRD